MVRRGVRRTGEHRQGCTAVQGSETHPAGQRGPQHHGLPGRPQNQEKLHRDDDHCAPVLVCANSGADGSCPRRAREAREGDRRFRFRPEGQRHQQRCRCRSRRLRHLLFRVPLPPDHQGPGLRRCGRHQARRFPLRIHPPGQGHPARRHGGRAKREGRARQGRRPARRGREGESGDEASAKAVFPVLRRGQVGQHLAGRVRQTDDGPEGNDGAGKRGSAVQECGCGRQRPYRLQRVRGPNDQIPQGRLRGRHTRKHEAGGLPYAPRGDCDHSPRRGCRRRGK
mmetsp:Transcript_23271/g.58862  ORF Transcript_23271/g.58862 Transcript_23271/m.58862 type:complete len:282 (-) Transcript_23271:968-1813(-)